MFRTSEEYIYDNRVDQVFMYQSFIPQSVWNIDVTRLLYYERNRRKCGHANLKSSEIKYESTFILKQGCL